MALLDSELARIKAELGFNLLLVGAEPYVGVTRYFEQIVVPNLSAGAITTSSTTVAVPPAGSPPTPVTLTLASATGFAMLNTVIVDVDDAQETATVQNVSGLTITVILRQAHSGQYPVAVEGGESVVREYLRRLRKVALQIGQWGSRAGIKKAGKVEFFGGAHEHSGAKTLGDLQAMLRSELCSLLFGVGNIRQFGRGGASLSVY